MKSNILFSIFAVVIFAACHSHSTTDKVDKDSYEKTKEDLGEKEKKSPASFITVEGHNRHNIIGQTVIKGTVTNKATVATYKDIELKLEYYSKTGTLLETDKETVYEVLGPGDSKNFKTKYFAPKGSDSVALSVTSAKVQ